MLREPQDPVKESGSLLKLNPLYPELEVMRGKTSATKEFIARKERSSA